jgi:hypothetical protein
MTSPKQRLDESENYELQEIEAFDKKLGHHGQRRTLDVG